jgi:hypothetical protein
MKLEFLRTAFAGIAGACLLSVAQPADAGNVVRDGFAFPKEGEVKIVVFRPDVQVGTLRVGGVDEPNADWTASARTNMQKAFGEAAEAREAKLEFLGDPEGENAKLLDDYRGLFQVVSNSAMTHAIFFDKLPTKQVKSADPKAKKKWKMDWTLGPEASRLKAATGADYAMFVYTHDSYGDAGRKVAQLLMAGLFGAYVPAGVHIGYAGLVDLNTGDLVWLNADIAMGGDPRDAEGAVKRVSQLMSGFPKRNSAVPAVK